MPLNRTDAVAAAAAALFLGLLTGESALVLAERGPGSPADPPEHCGSCDAWRAFPEPAAARRPCEDGRELPGIYADSLNGVSAQEYRFSDNHDPRTAFERVIAAPGSGARPTASRENRRCNG